MNTLNKITRFQNVKFNTSLAFILNKIILQQCNVYIRWKRHQVHLSFHSDARTPFSFQSDARTQFSFQSDARTPFSFHSDARTPFSFHSDARTT